MYQRPCPLYFTRICITNSQMQLGLRVRLGLEVHIRILRVFLNLFIYLFMAVLGLRFWARASSRCGKRGPLFIAVRGPLTIAASLVAEHRLQTRRLSNRGSRAQPLRGMWDLPRPGLEPVCPALAGRFSTTAPPGKPEGFFKINFLFRIVLQKSYKESSSISPLTHTHTQFALLLTS